MPSHLHEVLVELFQERPQLAPELAGPLGVAVPAFERALVTSGALTDVAATEYRADLVITLNTANTADPPVQAVVVEVQLHPDPHKRRSWPAYVGTLYARLGCRVVLLVICPDPGLAAKCAVPIQVGEPDFVLTPVVVGPGQVPLVTDPARAQRHPQLAVLSAMAHGAHEPEQKLVFQALLAALDVMDRDHATLYADIVLTVLPAAARDNLEALMTTTTYEYQSDFARRYFGQGRAEGEAKAVLAVLDARGIEVPDDVRERIAGCDDIEQLDAWVRRAVTATTAHDLFD